MPNLIEGFLEVKEYHPNILRRIERFGQLLYLTSKLVGCAVVFLKSGLRMSDRYGVRKGYNLLWTTRSHTLLTEESRAIGR